MRTLTLCADDFAQTGAIGDAILQLLAAGRLSATSVFAQAPAWPALAPQLAALPGVQVGLHFNLTHPWGEGERPLPYWLLASRLGRVDVAAVADALRRQLDAFTTHWGRAPDFIDGHQHVHALPGVCTALFAVLAERGLRPWLRAPERLGHPGEGRLKAWVLRAACHGFGRQAEALGCAVPRWFAGLYSLSAQADYPALMRAWLQAAPDGALLMCHPGRGRDVADPIAAARRREFDYLAGDEFAADCERAGFRVGAPRVV